MGESRELFLWLLVCQLPSAENNQCAKTAYLGVSYSDLQLMSLPEEIWIQKEDHVDTAHRWHLEAKVALEETKQADTLISDFSQSPEL